jgi:hypothetical protein
MENPENWVEKALLSQTLCPLGAHFSNGGILGHGQGGMPFLL